MTSRTDCSIAETLAGAIALGEAGETERESYRAHLAACEHCLNELGGEREIERVMMVPALARADERWEPDIRKALARRRAPRQAWRWGAAAAALVITLGGALALEKKADVGPPRTISAHESRAAIASIGTQSAVRREGRAESLVVGKPTVTTAFSVSVDARGKPVRCTITKSSGYRSLDRAVCATAMQGNY